MTTPPSLADRPQPHWTVRTNYGLRTGSFIDVFAAVAFQAWDRGHGVVFWCLVGLHLLVYPHVAYQVARRARQSLQAEVNNLTLDCLLLGLLVSALQFPLWIAFTVYIASTLNITISRGIPGWLRSQAAFALGAAVGIAIFGWHPSPASGWPATWLCVAGNAVYLGAIGVVAYQRNQQLRRTREALRAGELALQARLAEIQGLRDQLQEQAIRDPLTGLFNRRFLEDAFHRELARCQREGLPLTVMMVDVDHFKRVNDTHGHATGDLVLKALGALLLQQVRASDSACRYGGEEFVLLLPGMDADAARARADEWRQAFAALQVPVDGGVLNATVSIGIATHPAQGDAMAALLRCADEALYRAKAGGRNRVESYAAPPEPALSC